MAVAPSGSRPRANETVVTVGNLAEKRAVDFIIEPDPDCQGGLITPPPIGGAISPARMEYRPEGHVLGLFPSTRFYFVATVTDLDAKYVDPDLREFVQGPLKTRIFLQLLGMKPDLNDNGIDDTFRYADDAKRFLADLSGPLEKFTLNLHPRKSRLVEFGRFGARNRAQRRGGKPETLPTGNDYAV